MIIQINSNAANIATIAITDSHVLESESVIAESVRVLLIVAAVSNESE